MIIYSTPSGLDHFVTTHPQGVALGYNIFPLREKN
jgi:hypothetical protein